MGSFCSSSYYSVDVDDSYENEPEIIILLVANLENPFSGSGALTVSDQDLFKTGKKVSTSAQAMLIDLWTMILLAKRNGNKVSFKYLEEAYQQAMKQNPNNQCFIDTSNHLTELISFSQSCGLLKQPNLEELQ